MENAPRRPKQAVYTLTRSKFLTSPELEHLELVLHRNLKSQQNRRDALMLLLALHLGGRAAEILALRKTDFDQQRGSIFVTGIKGSNDREIPIPKWLALEVRGYLRPMFPADRIFPITYNRLRQIWLEYRPVKKTFHCLRHTFALNLFIRERDIKLVQLALGHRSITNTMIYVDFVYSINELRRIAE